MLQAGYEAVRAHRSDAILAVGGGSAIDAAKVIGAAIPGFLLMAICFAIYLIAVAIWAEPGVWLSLLNLRTLSLVFVTGPLGGSILGRSGIIDAYRTGRLTSDELAAVTVHRALRRGERPVYLYLGQLLAHDPSADDGRALALFALEAEPAAMQLDHRPDQRQADAEVVRGIAVVEAVEPVAGVVAVGCVDKIDAAIQRPIKLVMTLLFGVLISPGHTAEAYPADLQAGPAQY